jgi:hypothetical protein
MVSRSKEEGRNGDFIAPIWTGREKREGRNGGADVGIAREKGREKEMEILLLDPLKLQNLFVFLGIKFKLIENGASNILNVTKLV